MDDGHITSRHSKSSWRRSRSELQPAAASGAVSARLSVRACLCCTVRWGVRP